MNTKQYFHKNLTLFIFNFLLISLLNPVSGYKLNKFSPRKYSPASSFHTNNQMVVQTPPEQNIIPPLQKAKSVGGGGVGRVDVDVAQNDDNKLNDDEVLPSNTKNSPAEEDYSLEEEEEPEPKCPKNFWWHLRGQRCVPVNCIGGNSQRVRETGKCIRKSLRKFNKGPIIFFSRGSSHRRYVPSRSHYGRPMRGMAMMNF